MRKLPFCASNRSWRLGNVRRAHTAPSPRRDVSCLVGLLRLPPPIWQALMQALITDLGEPHPKRIARVLGVSVRTVYRYNRNWPRSWRSTGPTPPPTAEARMHGCPDRVLSPCRGSDGTAARSRMGSGPARSSAAGLRPVAAAGQPFRPRRLRWRPVRPSVPPCGQPFHHRARPAPARSS